jgi:hypothetical protein
MAEMGRAMAAALDLMLLAGAYGAAGPADGGWGLWGPGEPVSKGSTNENCATATSDYAADASGAYHWQQFSCDELLPYFCRMIGGF